MSDVITSFLVGLGIQYDDTGSKKFNESLSGIESATLKAGSVLSSAMAAAGVVISNNAQHIANVNLEASRMSVSSQYVLQYGAAIERMGGNADDAIGQLQTLDRIMDDLHTRGRSDTLNELAQASFNVQNLSQATDAQDLQRRIADEYQHANSSQRRVASSILGTDPATANLYSGGSEYLRQQVDDAGNLQHITQSLIDKSAQYNLSLRDAQSSWNGLVNTASNQYLPLLDSIATKSSQAFKQLDAWVQQHPQAANAVAENGLAITVGSLLSAGAGILSKIGVPGLATIASRAFPTVALATVGSYVAQEYVAPFDQRYPILQNLAAPINYLNNLGTQKATSDPSIYRNETLQGIWDTLTGHSDDHKPSNAPVKSDVPDWRQGETANNAHNAYSDDNSDHSSHDVYDSGNVQTVTHNAFNYQHLYTAENVVPRDNDSHYEKQAAATSKALQSAPVRVDNRLEARLFMDGREIDSRIERFEESANRNMVNMNGSQVER